MTISTTASSVTIGGNGSTTAFNFPFIAGAASNVVVTYTDANSNATVLLQGSQYTLSINPPAAGQIWGVGGTVTYPLSGSAIPAGSYLTIQRLVPFTQLTSISNQGDFYPQAVERAFDTLEMQIQQGGFQTGRALLFNIADNGPFGTLPIATVRAGKILGFDSLGNPGVFTQLPFGSVSSALAPVVLAPTTSAALALLGVSAAVQPAVAASTIQAAVNTLLAHSAATQVATGFFAQSAGAIVNRLNDRALIGAATVNDGNSPSTINDWLTALIPATVDLAQLGALSTVGGIALLGGSRTSDSATAGAEGCIGLSGFAINDNVAQVQTAYAGYFEARRYINSGITQGIESDIINLGGVVSVDSYQMVQSGITPNLILSSGRPDITGCKNATYALGVTNNGAAYEAGIVFQNTSLDNTSGAAHAIVLAQTHALVWYGSAGLVTAQIRSDATTASGELIFSNGLVSIDNPAGASFMAINTSTTSLPSASTALQLLVNNNAGNNGVTVTLGAVNSGGTGFRALIVPN